MIYNSRNVSVLAETMVSIIYFVCLFVCFEECAITSQWRRRLKSVRKPANLLYDN